MGYNKSYIVINYYRKEVPMTENNSEQTILLEEFAKLNKRLSSIETRLQNIEQNTVKTPFAPSANAQGTQDNEMIAMLMEHKYGKKTANLQQTQSNNTNASVENETLQSHTTQAPAQTVYTAQSAKEQGSQINIQNKNYFTVPNATFAPPTPPATEQKPVAQRPPMPQQPPVAPHPPLQQMQKTGKQTMDYGQLYGAKPSNPQYSASAQANINAPAPQHSFTANYTPPQTPPNVAPNYTPPSHAQTPPKPKANFETTIVKNVVSVAAALLIFAGLASLAVLVYDQLPDILKVALMFVFSFGLAGIGFFASKKKASVLGTALIASGIGGTYISLLSTYVFFGMINQYAFFALTGVLAVATLFIPKHYNNAVYGVIGIIGVIVSTALGFNNYSSHGELLFLAIYFIVLSGVFLFFATRTTVVARYIIITGAMLTTWTISTYLTTISNHYLSQSYSAIFAMILILAFNLTLVVYGTKITYYIPQKSGANILGGFLLIVSTFFAQILVTEISYSFNTRISVDSEIIIAMLVILFVFAQGAFIDNKTKTLGAVYSSILIYDIALLWGDSIFEDTLPLIGFLPIVLPLAIYAIFKSEKLFFIHALIILGISSNLALFYVDDNAFAMGLQLLFIVLIFVLYYKNVVVQKTRIGLYFLALNLTFLFANEATSMTLKAITNTTRLDIQGAYLTDVYALSATALVTIMLCLRNFAGKGETLQEISGKLLDETRKTTLYLILKILNTLLLLGLMAYLQNLHINYFTKFFIVLVTAVQMFVGLRDALDIKNNKWSGFYVGIKFTIYLNYVLYSFIDYSEYAYLLSIVSLALAIASIFFGFHKEILSFRLFGLYLSLISVLKLLLVDISYENSLLRVGSFIFSGILCYGIVYLYQKKTKEEETEEIEQG